MHDAHDSEGTKKARDPDNPYEAQGREGGAVGPLFVRHEVGEGAGHL